MNFGMDTYNFYFIEIRLIVEEGGIEIFPQHYRGYLKKSRFTNLLISHPFPPPINNERSLNRKKKNVFTCFFCLQAVSAGTKERDKTLFDVADKQKREGRIHTKKNINFDYKKKPR